MNSTSHRDRILLAWLPASWCGFVLLPRYPQDDGFFAFAWANANYLTDRDFAPGIVQAFALGRNWLLPFVVLLGLPFLAFHSPAESIQRANWLISAAVPGLAARGSVKGDRLVAGTTGLVVAAVVPLVFITTALIVSGAFESEAGQFFRHLVPRPSTG